MASIRQRKTGSRHWQVQIRLAGKASVTRTFPTYEEAAEFAARNTVGLKYDGESAEKFRRTVGDAIDRYIELSGAKLVPFDLKVLEFWKKRLGSERLAPFDMVAFLSARAELTRQTAKRGDRIGQKLTVASINRRVARLSAVFKFAQRTLRWLDQHPFRDTDGVWAKETARRSREQVLLTDAEFGRLIAACRASESPMLLPWVLLQACTGCRNSELQRLRWADLDLDRGIAVVLESKNGTARAVPIVGDAVAELRALKASRKVGSIDGRDLVFHAAGEPTKAFRPEYWWRIARDAAGLGKGRPDGKKPFLLHGFRHRMATALMNSKVSDTKGASITGHKTLSVYRRYQHLQPEDVAETGQAIAHVLLPKRSEEA